MFVFIGRLILLLIVISAIKWAVQKIQNILGLSAGPIALRSQPLPDRRAATLLQQDPVCGTYVSGEHSLKRIVRGKVVHFCSAECRDRFQAV
jgi:YHS domain-containing protein